MTKKTAEFPNKILLKKYHRLNLKFIFRDFFFTFSDIYSILALITLKT